jgi:hypothetical protein
MPILHAVLVYGFLALVGMSSALADIKGPNGEKCDSTETNVKHDIKDKPGKHYTCDKCVFSKCDAKGKEINKCQITTHWTNCVEVQANPPKK